MNSKIKKMVTATFAFILLTAVVGGIYAFDSKQEIQQPAVKGKLVDYKWFQISGTYSPSSAVPRANATYLGEGPTPPAGTGCNGSINQCISGFNTSQVTSSNQLINDSQVPQSTPVRKS